jgi:hypothetical protein
MPFWIALLRGHSEVLCGFSEVLFDSEPIKESFSAVLLGFE